MYIAGKVKCIINVQTGLSSENYAKQKKKKRMQNICYTIRGGQGDGGKASNMI